MTQAKTSRWGGPPLALQILGLLIGGLVVAQLVTLLLTMLLPPAPAPQYGLDDIAAALRGQTSAGADGGRSLQRLVQSGPPDISGPGWLVSERSRRDLAGLLGASADDVSLAFFTPLPFAGTAAAPAITLKVDDGPVPSLRRLSAGGDAAPARLILAGLSDDAVAGSAIGLQRALTPIERPPSRDALPPGLFPGGAPAAESFQGRRPPAGPAAIPFDRPTTLRPGSLFEVAPARAGAGIYIPGDGGAAVPPLLQAPQAILPATIANPPAAALAPPITAVPAEGFRPLRGLPGELRLMRQLPIMAPIEGPTDLPALLPPPIVAGPAIVERRPPVIAHVPATEPSVIAALPARADPILPAPPPVAAMPQPAVEPRAGPPIAVTAPARSLFGLAPAPFVEGDFVAALRLADGRWAVVQPAPEPFPNSWQRRLLLWFVIAFAIVAPLGWLFARRLVKPLGQFAAAAEMLGRDPAAAIIAVEGPAEIGRAAHAFNLMQTRLRSFVDDRTAMIGAISHDLRTPLTRMRFRIEDVPDDVRDGLLDEVAEMEAMITSVLEFIRDASSPGLRERLDLRTLVDDVVEGAVMIGNDVTVERSQSATVDIDVLGMRRVLDNLLENAIKYGVRARVRLRTDATNALAEIIDDGPGLPDDELERVFEPFYRSESARSSDKDGHGLGLAVCRSIARAHGGDVRLLRSSEGFLAQIRLPLAYGALRPLAA